MFYSNDEVNYCSSNAFENHGLLQKNASFPTGNAVEKLLRVSREMSWE